jgi:hypothetical protein
MGKIFSTSIKRKHISASMDVGKWTCVAVEYLKWQMQNEYLKVCCCQNLSERNRSCKSTIAPVKIVSRLIVNHGCKGISSSKV